MASTSRRFRSTSLGVFAAAAALVAGACGGGTPATSSPTASTGPSPTATAAPSASAIPSPSASPSPTAESPSPTADATTEPSASAAAADPTEGLTIAEPYALEPLDDASAAAFEEGVGESLGAMGDVIEFGALTVTRDGEDVGVVMAMAFPGVPGAEEPEFFRSVMGGVAGSSGGEVEETTIGGKTVGLTEGGGAAFAGYQEGDTVIFAVSQSIDESTDIVTALIEANG